MTYYRKTSRPSKEPLREPPADAWIKIATQVAKDACIRPTLVLDGTKTIPVVRARWRAWRIIKDTFPETSLAGIGRVSGFHHTTVLYGIARDRGEGEKVGYKFNRKERPSCSS
jgi:hypothetical protein